MTIILDELKLVYTPVPKAACTSLKMMFFRIENEHDFLPFKRSGRIFHIHNVYPSVLFNKSLNSLPGGYSRFLLIRDPIQRLLSAYSNRVIHHRELSYDKARKELISHDLAPNPGLEDFILNLDKYAKAVETINHHTRPLVDFTGKNVDFYSHIYKIGEIMKMVSDISVIVGKNLNLEHLQTGGPKINSSDLSGIAVDKLNSFYAEDYEIFKKYL